MSQPKNILIYGGKDTGSEIKKQLEESRDIPMNVTIQGKTSAEELKDILEKNNFEVIIFPSGKELGIGKQAKKRFNIPKLVERIVSNVRKSKKKKYIKALEGFDPSPIIILKTNYTSDEGEGSIQEQLGVPEHWKIIDTASDTAKSIHDILSA